MAGVNQNQMTPAESIKQVKRLITNKTKITKKDWIPGNVVFTYYFAKYQNLVYDHTPLVLILKRNSTHTLGLNFHWLPFKMRVNLVKHILNLNKKNVAKGKPLEFSYEQMKPLLKHYGYAPCIRKYINKRFRSSGTVVGPDMLSQVARLRSETLFTTGKKYTAEQLFAMAQKAGRRRAKAKKHSKAAYKRNKKK